MPDIEQDRSEDIDLGTDGDAGGEYAGDDDYDEGVEYDDWAPAAPARWWSWTALVLSMAGLGDALYLTIDHFTGTLPVCSATGIIDCAKVTTSAQSEFLGMPVALLGLIFFTLMVPLNVPPLWRPHLIWVTRARLALSLVGIVSVVYLLIAELFVIKAICLWCTGVHIITFFIFLLVVATFPAMSNAWAAGSED